MEAHNGDDTSTFDTPVVVLSDENPAAIISRRNSDGSQSDTGTTAENNPSIVSAIPLLNEAHVDEFGLEQGEGQPAAQVSLSRTDDHEAISHPSLNRMEECASDPTFSDSNEQEEPQQEQQHQQQHQQQPTPEPNALSRLSQKYEALGHPPLPTPRADVDSHVSTSDDVETLKLRQLQVLEDSRKQSTADTPTDEMSSTVVVTTTPSPTPLHVFAEALVLGAVEDGGSATSIPQPTSASPPPHDVVAADLHRDDNQEQHNAPRRFSRRQLIAVTIVALVVVVVVVASVVGTTCGLSSGCLRQHSNAISVDPAVNNTKPNAISTSAPVTDPPIVQSAILDYINNITLTKKTIATSTGNRGAEALALRWLLNDDNFTFDESSLSTLDSQWQLRQRYAIATLYIQNVDPLDMNARHECDWSGISCQAINVNGTNTTAVTEIHLRDMEWTGALSADLGLLSHVKRIDWYQNRFSGTWPSALGQYWTNLQYLSLKGNRLTGTLPSTVGAWSKLEHLDLYTHLLSGTLPTSIGNWTSLTFFDVYTDTVNRRLHGTLPGDAIGRWTNLEHFNVAGNAFTSTLPNSIVNWTNLATFDLDSNDFTGTLPAVQWPKLRFFNAEFNALSGTIPSSFGTFTGLRLAYFYENNFTGTVPGGICNAPNLTDLRADCLVDVVCTCCHYCE